MGSPATQAGSPDVDYFTRPPSKLKKRPVNFRAHPTLYAQLEGIQKLWRLKAEYEEGMSKEDAHESVDITYVCERLLSVGIAGTWKEEGERLGLPGMPKGPEDWARLADALANAAKK